MKRVLVGVDGGAMSQRALRWAADLCRRAELECVAAHVFTPNQAELSPDLDADLHARQRDELEGWCRSVAPATHFELVLLDGDVPDALLSEARDRDADLLVVGRREDSGPPGTQLSSVAHSLVQQTTIPLAIGPDRDDATVSHFVVGVDGSAGSLAAVDLVAGLARRLDAAVTAVLASDPLIELVSDPDRNSWRSHAEITVRRWCTPIEKAGVPLEIALEFDLHPDVHPVPAIARAVAEHPGAVASVGGRELSDVTGLRAGHVPLHLVHHTDAAVILVPPAPDTLTGARSSR